MSSGSKQLGLASPSGFSSWTQSSSTQGDCTSAPATKAFSKVGCSLSTPVSSTAIPMPPPSKASEEPCEAPA
jgi:hypothetical protein